MGPLRRGLILCVLPLPAWAEVCDKQRPNWDGTPVSTLNEAILLFSSAPALILLIVTAFVIRFKHQWGALVMVVLWAIFASFASFYDADIKQSAIIEGCMGPSTLFVAVVAAICIGLILYVVPRPKHD